ncbi:VLDLR [Lepeophtheirus salmonis]|uniref:VLDLR n=1 Tax=Lepeophtheirus salmonis TaxID=72036 RepID=A0A7R8D422_LEPSM|nr:VLDLR [Lepeophtheirus salmonis]CAF3022146.1 VLDLR [Lepeophtheirus salmonis]
MLISFGRLFIVFNCILIQERIISASTTCNSDNEFKCHNGICIPKYHVCDGISHCRDSSDENFCLQEKRSRSDNEGVVSIIASFRDSFRNFVRDIMKEVGTLLRRKKSDGGAETVECKSNDAFFCSVDNICISLSARCDTKDDCSDGEDENPNICDFLGGSSLRRNIVTLGKSRRTMSVIPRLSSDNSKSSSFSSSHETRTVKVICNSRQFACDNTCIPLSWVCDDLEDCIDKTDENQEKCKSKKEK